MQLQGLIELRPSPIKSQQEFDIRRIFSTWPTSFRNLINLFEMQK